MAVSEGLLSPDELELLRQLRHLRNPDAHTRPLNDSKCVIRVARERQTAPERLFEEDARKAMGIVMWLLSRSPLAYSQPGGDEAEHP
jgi:hypothetical protein